MAETPIRSIRMSDELFEEMKLYCSVMDITMAQFIKEAVDEQIKKSINTNGFRQRAEALFRRDRSTLERLLQLGGIDG